MRVIRRFAVLAVSVTALGVLLAPSALASSSQFKKGGEPTCAVTTTSRSSSSTTCTGSLSSGGLNGQQWLANVDVGGFAVYQCQDSTGATVPGQNQVLGDAETSTSFQTNSKSTSFTTDPTVLSAQSTVSASQAGCAGGSTAVGPTLTTTRITLWIVVPTGSIFATCTASDPNGLSGTIALSC